MLRTRENYQKKPKPKAITRIKWEEAKICNKQLEDQKVGE